MRVEMEPGLHTTLPDTISDQDVSKHIKEMLKKIDEIKKKEDEKPDEINYLEEFCMNTYMNGVKNVYKADNWILRMLWILIILAAFAGFIFCILYQIKFFFLLL